MPRTGSAFAPANPIPSAAAQSALDGRKLAAHFFAVDAPTPSPSTYAVELAGVCKRLGRHPAVDQITLSVHRGEFFSLLGPSGCGKSTTLRLIAGFERADAGEIRLLGRRVNEVPAHARDVNLVFQNYALFPHLTVRGNVAFGLEMERVPARERERRVEEMLELVQMGGLGDRLPRQLSGGQQQRVAVARALATRPSVLLLDEPLGALDLQLRQQMQRELRALQRGLGLTFIHVTHDQEEALTLSDRLAVLHEGRVLQAGTPEEIYERPATRFVAAFIGQSNFLSATAADAVEAAAGRFAIAGLPIRLVPGAAAVAAARDLVLALRPERIALGAAAAAAEVQTRGVVEDIVYSGTERRFHVRLDNGLGLLVSQQAHGGEIPRRGETVALGWAAADMAPVDGSR